MNFIIKQNHIFLNSISLIASENYSFYDDFIDIYKSDLTWRYSFFENKTFQKSFSWHDNIFKIQEDVTNSFKKLLNSDYVTLSSLSWMNALFNILLSFTNTWDLVYFISPDCWWHTSSSKIAKKLWLRVKYIPFNNLTKNIDFNLFRDELLFNKPKLIYVDQMTGIYPISLLWIKDIIDKNGIIAYNDISHNWAFVISWVHLNPLLDGYNIFWWSTHKTIPWPQKAFIATNNIEYYNILINSLNFFVSNINPLNIAILWKLLELMDWKWYNYTTQIIKNSNYFSEKIKNIWFELVYDWLNFSKNHQVLFFTEPIITSSDFFSGLSELWIFVNILPLPFSNSRIWIRVGLQEFTFLWGKESDIDKIIDILKDLLNNINFEKNKLEISKLKIELLNNFKNFYAKL